MRALIGLLFVSCFVLSCYGQSSSLRVATYNTSLYASEEGEIARRLGPGDDTQAKTLAEVIQRVQPDLILLNEFDYDPTGQLTGIFKANYLAKPQNIVGAVKPAEAAEFGYWYSALTNTGLHSGYDLDRSGGIDPRPGSREYGADCWGFGHYPGQYGMAVYSKHPILSDRVRTFQNFRWKDMPGAKLPQQDGQAWYSAEVLERFPLSSKSHWDVPIDVDGTVIHLLASHPTPPTFDGPENRNGLRNFDEIRFWCDYVTGKGDYIYDDHGAKGGLPQGSLFVVLGDLNSDPCDGESSGSILQLLSVLTLPTDSIPKSKGGVEQAKQQGGANATHRGNPAYDTLDAEDDPGPGNLRLDYVLPSEGIRITRSGVYWPGSDDPLSRLTGVHPFPGSDHRLVWAELEW